ncbi:MAG TPA: hypothetical protein PLF71_02405 [bacterium]|nr:MAG: hypothetical protein BWY14_00676 [Parcubacteria group bacterium ADurb.Bin192]HPN14944.1 hypothetical protein [bacterium]
MSKSFKKSNRPAPKTSSSASVWAVVSILSFPTVALSLATLGWNSLAAFLLACLATISILILEAFTRGKVWIFDDKFRHIFDHEDTPFRIIVVAGGMLLILETILIVETFRNPAFDGFILNIMAKKQCASPTSYVAKIICPHYTGSTATQSKNLKQREFPLKYSLEQAAKTHLLPNAVAGSCAILPAQWPNYAQDDRSVKFFAYCKQSPAGSCTPGGESVSAIITTELMRNELGYYVPLTWQEDRQSQAYQNIINHPEAVKMMDDYLNERCKNITQVFLKPLGE